MPLSAEDIVRVLFAARTRISAVVWLLTRDSQAAEDIFQASAVKALGAGVWFETEGQLLSWAQVVARRAAIDWLRRRKPETPLLDADVLELMGAQAQATATPEGARVDALRDCLESAPPHARRLLELRYFEGRSCEEVARAVGVKLPAIYQRLSRLHRALKECVERRMAGGPSLLGENAEAT